MVSIATFVWLFDIKIPNAALKSRKSARLEYYYILSVYMRAIRKIYKQHCMQIKIISFIRSYGAINVNGLLVRYGFLWDTHTQCHAQTSTNIRSRQLSLLRIVVYQLKRKFNQGNKSYQIGSIEGLYSFLIYIYRFHWCIAYICVMTIESHHSVMWYIHQKIIPVRISLQV